MSLLIAFGYRAQHGKDTAAAHIIAERSDKFDIRRFAFADLLKVEMFHALVNRTDPFWFFMEKYNGTFFQSVLIPKPENPFLSEPADKIAWINANKAPLRLLLQVYGSEYRRRQDPFYWVRALGLKINENPPQIALITDMRFINEALFIKANDGYTVNVERIGFADPTATEHASEHQLAKYLFDYTIRVPEGAIEELKSDALEVFDSIVAGETPADMSTEDFTEEAFADAA